MNVLPVNQKIEDQRNGERRLVSGWRATVFGGDSMVLTQLEVEDSSSGGAGLLANGAVQRLDKDLILTISIESRQQRFTRKARVRWISQQAGETRFGVEYIDHVGFVPDSHSLNLDEVRVCPACIAKLPGNIAMRQKALPFLMENDVMHVACAAPMNHASVKLLERFIKAKLRFWQTDEAQLERRLKQVYANQPGGMRALPSAVAGDGNRHGAVNLGDDLLYAAYMRQASDIHIDPNYEGALIRFRTDGMLETYNSINTHVYTELVSRLKVMAGLDIAEKRSPQDGRFSHQFESGGRRTDVRVATLPTKYGERLTMRLLAVRTDSLTLDRLGFEPEQKHRIERFLLRTQGMMIMTGPTGSGKTTTLYAAIRMLLAERSVNVITIEDPIEYEIAGVAQCEVDDGNRLNFAKALRSILRHDPDVVMIGEIRDRETADIAIKAALTGHMVLGTLHTNSAAATVTRLLDMGVEPYLVAAALRLAVAQRLLRRLCRHCRIPRPMTELEAISIGRPDLGHKTIHDPCGCIYCGGKGFSGRIGLYEMLELNEEWARGITQGEGEIHLVKSMREAGVKSLIDDAVDKLLSGETALSEVIQIASSW
ncbi:Flp pilus assembly complex ATPase component TadA [Methylomonas sp. LL1]|uniref:GspE/PulE family protein n=1 Tax=Methylomonas sp. LL1 TaxID=2785785 RepID=UPI0018C367B4|nr:ATPase, T2SS/T4P/T4SS family [Methylomonas sp. LL1]QPK61494.1 Flp pilus assembly complex ATPase component TadA [Methylomonas sp. LL1]